MLRNQTDNRGRLGIVAISFLFLTLWIIGRLFVLQILQYDYYSLFALNTHEISKRLNPERGEIMFQDTRTKEHFPAAINKEFYLIYAVPVEIQASDVASTTAALAAVLNLDINQRDLLSQKLSKVNDRYESVARKVSAEQKDLVKSMNLKGIYFTTEVYRYYPEEGLDGNLLGFVGWNDNGSMGGKYGIEGYWEKSLAGKGGFMVGERGALGSWIALSDRTLKIAENGQNLVLTIDRALQFKACERLKQGMEDYKAKSGALVLMNPETGAVLAMCSLPDFDPNNYSKVDDAQAFNNTAVFGSYEPGSVFKPITMAAGLDLGLISPGTTFTDPCVRKMNDYEIHNAENKCYGVQTMTQVLEKSINTGVVWVQEKMGNEKFKNYVEKFGFGVKTGVTLSFESAGDISSLSKKGQIFGANGSFGQGITATPLQLAAAYSAIANGGKLSKSQIVEEVLYPDNKHESVDPQVIEQVIIPRSAKLLSAMLTSVVENHYTKAKIPGYYVAGKTGTAQIAERGKYSVERTNHTFAGFAPATNPKLVLVVKYEEPNMPWAEQTTLPVFRDVLKFALDYYGIPGDK